MNILYVIKYCSLFILQVLYITILLPTNILTLNPNDLLYMQPNNFLDIRCHLNTREESYDLPLAADDETYPEKSIFFIVTNCRRGLDSRETCAIEAAAKANPSWQINVLFAGPVAKAFLRHNTLLDLEKFQNVKVKRIHVHKFVKNSPVENLFHPKTGLLWKSNWPSHDAQTILKILTLNKYGGVYLDLDVYAVKPFDYLPRNFVGSELGKYIGTSVVAASKHETGRNFTEAILRELQADFQPYIWRYNGADLTTRVLENMCSTTNVAEMSAKTCNGFDVLEDKYIYPIDYFHWWVYFEPWEFNYEEAYTHHLWSFMSMNVTVTPDSLFTKIAKKHCPTVYEMYGDKFGTMRFINI